MGKNIQIFKSQFHVQQEHPIAVDPQRAWDECVNDGGIFKVYCKQKANAVGS